MAVRLGAGSGTLPEAQRAFRERASRTVEAQTWLLVPDKWSRRGDNLLRVTAGTTAQVRLHLSHSDMLHI